MLSKGGANKKRPAVFLDRDGTLNYERDHLRRSRDLRLLPGATRAVKALNDAGFLVVVVTNQAAIAKGILTEDELHTIHSDLLDRLSGRGARIDAIYYCPHHVDGIVTRYRIRCRCRKPGIGMITKAAKDLNIDLKKSYMVGDMTGDIALGERAKLTTILVRTGYAGGDKRFDIRPDFTARNLHEAVTFIKKYAKRR